MTFFNTSDGCNINLLTVYVLKNVSCEYDLFEWLKLNFASCVVHQTRALSAPKSRFSAISPPLGLVSSRDLRPAIALSREGRVRVRVRPRRGRRAALAR